MKKWYHACSRCTAKWFADSQTCRCLRCNLESTASEKLTPPWLASPATTVTAKINGQTVSFTGKLGGNSFRVDELDALQLAITHAKRTIGSQPEVSETELIRRQLEPAPE